MGTLEHTQDNVADLHWLATVLTGRRETADDVIFQALSSVEEAFPLGMNALSRRIFIAQALAPVRKDLAASARRTVWRRTEKASMPPRSWTLDGETTRSELERALLPIDVFPRAAVLLLLFERVPLSETAILLDAKPDLVRTALAVGALELTVNLARLQGWQPVAIGSRTNQSYRPNRPALNGAL